MTDPPALENHHVDELIGRGRISTVWGGRDGLGRPVAIKDMVEIAPARLDAELSRLNVLVELTDHPHLLTVYAVRRHGRGRIALITDRSAAASLPSSGAPLPVEPALTWAREIADALASLHGAEHPHLDVRPRKLARDPAGRLALRDVGLARTWAAALGSDHRTDADDVVYLAPELRTGAAVSPATDVFGLAACLYRLLAGFAPYHDSAAEPASVIARAASADPTPLGSLGVPPEVATFVSRCMAAQPAHRPGSAAAVRDELDQLLELLRSTDTASRLGEADRGPDAAERGALLQMLERIPADEGPRAGISRRDLHEPDEPVVPGDEDIAAGLAPAQSEPEPEPSSATADLLQHRPPQPTPAQVDRMQEPDEPEVIEYSSAATAQRLNQPDTPATAAPLAPVGGQPIAPWTPDQAPMSPTTGAASRPAGGPRSNGPLIAAAVLLLGVIVVGGLMLRSDSTPDEGEVAVATTSEDDGEGDADAPSSPEGDADTDQPIALETPLDLGSPALGDLPLPLLAGQPAPWEAGLLAGPEDLAVVGGQLLVVDQVDRRVYRGSPAGLDVAIGSGQPGPTLEQSDRARAINLELPVAVAAAEDGRIVVADRRVLWRIDGDAAESLSTVDFDPTDIAVTADGTVVVSGGRSATGSPGPLLRQSQAGFDPIGATGVQDPRALLAVGGDLLVLDSGTVPIDGQLPPNVLWRVDPTIGSVEQLIGGAVLSEPIAMARADEADGGLLAILQQQPQLGIDAQGRPDPQVVLGFDYSLHLVELDDGGSPVGSGRTVALGPEVLRPRAIAWLGSQIIIADRGQGRLLTYDADGAFVEGGDPDAYPCANQGSAVGLPLRGPVRVSRGAGGSVIADSGTGCVLTLDATGRVTSDLQINLGVLSIQGVAMTDDGRVFISDGGLGGTGQVIEVTGGQLARVVGTGSDPAAQATGGRLGDDDERSATELLLDGPTALAAHDGVLYVLDSQEQVIAVTLSDLQARRAVPAALLSQVDAQTLADIDASDDGLYLASLTQGRLFRATWPSGSAAFGPGAEMEVIATALGQPQAVGLRPDGTALVIDRGTSALIELPEGRPRTVFGQGSETVPDGAPADVAVTDDGSVLVVDQAARLVWRSS